LTEKLLKTLGSFAAISAYDINNYAPRLQPSEERALNFVVLAEVLLQGMRDMLHDRGEKRKA
jgi:hypothetical protein